MVERNNHLASELTRLITEILDWQVDTANMIEDLIGGTRWNSKTYRKENVLVDDSDEGSGEPPPWGGYEELDVPVYEDIWNLAVDAVDELTTLIPIQPILGEFGVDDMASLGGHRRGVGGRRQGPRCPSARDPGCEPPDRRVRSGAGRGAAGPLGQPDRPDRRRLGGQPGTGDRRRSRPGADRSDQGGPRSQPGGSGGRRQGPGRARCRPPGRATSRSASTPATSTGRSTSRRSVTSSTVRRTSPGSATIRTAGRPVGPPTVPTSATGWRASSRPGIGPDLGTGRPAPAWPAGRTIPPARARPPQSAWRSERPGGRNEPGGRNSRRSA